MPKPETVKSLTGLIEIGMQANPNTAVFRGVTSSKYKLIPSVGRNRSRVDGDKRTEVIEPRSDYPDASVDPTNGTSLGASHF